MMQGDGLKDFRVDDDTLTVPYHYDRDSALLIGQFPEFEEAPRYTSHGRPWKNAVTTGCPYAAGEYDDCGSCPFLVKADPRDIIGVCFHERLRRGASPGETPAGRDTTQPGGY